jgi:RHS repeat-associated protein
MRFLLTLAAAVFPASVFASGTTAIGPCPPGFVEAPQSAGGPVTIVEGGIGGTVACMPALPLRAAEPASRPSPFPVRDFRDPMPVDASVLRLVSLNPRSPTELAQQTSTRVLTRTYDDFDRVKTETVPLEDGGTATIRYTYWRNGVRKTMQDVFGRVTFYEYDGKNRLSRVTANQGRPDQHVTEYTYWPDDLLKTIAAPNGVLTSYGYDRADRVTSIAITHETVTLLSYAYTYDPNGNRLSQLETNGGVPELTTYTYDRRDRLVTVTYPSGASVEYGYDQVSNRTGEIERDASGTIVSDKTAVFDAINRLTSVTDPVDPSNDATFTYDANGNLHTKTTAAGTETYDYDPRDPMVEARKGTEIVARYAYDAFGRRYLKVSSEGAFVSVVRQYLYDQTSLLHELDSDDLEVAKYEYTGDRLASLARRDEPRRYYHQDALGSVVALSDAAGAVVARYHLDAWGRYRAPSELDASANRFGFTGYLFDQETELYWAKARFYDPEYGRFTSQDSVLGEINEPPSLHRYFYGYANPLRYVDPTGHCVALPGFCEAVVTNLVANTRNANFAGSSSGSSAGKLLNFGLHAGIESVGNALTLPQKAATSALDTLTPGGLSYWGGNKVDMRDAPARAQQVAALDAAADPSRSFAERGLYGALSVLSTPVTVVEGVTTAPGGRAAERLGQSAHQAETAKTVDDYAFAQLEAFGDLVGAFNSYGALAAPFAPKLAAGSRALPGETLVRQPALPRVAGGSQAADVLDAVAPGSASTAPLTTETALARSPWPENRGFIEGTVSHGHLRIGETFDRYGFDSGTFGSPVGTSLPARALRPGSEKLPYSQFEVLKPLQRSSGGIAPAFGKPGLGTQFEFPVPIDVLIRRGFIKRVP